MQSGEEESSKSSAGAEPQQAEAAPDAELLPVDDEVVDASDSSLPLPSLALFGV